MIISKPKKQTLFSLSVFFILCMVCSWYAGYFIFFKGYQSFWLALLFGVATPAGVVILIKTLISYKTLYLGKHKMDVVYFWGIKKRRFHLKDLTNWFETNIKTYNGNFKELTMQFTQKIKIKITQQENNNYEKVIKYLNKNFKNKMINY